MSQQKLIIVLLVVCTSMVFGQDAPVLTKTVATDLATGTYMFTATDSGGCATIETITVTSLSDGVSCFGVGTSRN